MFSRLKSLFANPPQPERHDPELGRLVFDGGVWAGSVLHEGRDLSFVVAGTDQEPDAGLLDGIRGLLARFQEAERIAMEFLQSNEESIHQTLLEFYALEFLQRDKPDDFAFEFLADGDDSQVWRIEFIAGKPSQTGFDD